ncbi:CLUMA_CG018169, isoform A [Clunio marinus]|uniref:CLUMA_CG018169, isoform A n=1 Tax=Clunio marinus TaxID=568069 RepID=A0A1J1IXP1_9DIPT|nr:CLUMA_CG018169, isoform A [Clunio marinus]
MGLAKIFANETFRMLFIAAGIMVCFLYYGVMQEKIMRGCYGGEVREGGKCEGGEKYEYEFMLVGCLSLSYAIVARLLLLCKSSEEKDKTHQGWYAASAFTYLAAMVCGNMALRFITYPTQVIAKSSKPIPVMIIGVLLAHKRYTIQKYFFVILIVVGVIMFIYKDGKSGEEKDNSSIGLILIGMSLLSDGVLGAIEDRMRAATKPSALNFMFSINMFAAIFLAVIVVASGEISHFFTFATKYPEVYMKIGTLAIVGSFGQVFIFMMISEFGPLPCSIVTTTRKFFTVLISVIFLGNALTTRQIVATGIVFSALFADAFFGKKQLCGPKAQPVPTQDPDVEKNTDTNGSPTKDAVELQKLNSNKTAE